MPTKEAVEQGYKENRVENCYIASRPGETLWYALDSGELITNLNGYAIIPMEEYQKLKDASQR